MCVVQVIVVKLAILRKCNLHPVIPPLGNLANLPPLNAPSGGRSNQLPLNQN